MSSGATAEMMCSATYCYLQLTQ